MTAELEVTERGLCWNTTGSPTIEDNKIVSSGSGLGEFTDSISGLKEGVTYYILAYAVNSAGVGYSPSASSYKACPSAFTVMHIEGLNGAPEDKTVVYHSVSTELSGSTLCWLTQNLGADSLATSVSDGTEPSGGWYWQFNRSQGYTHDGTVRTPSTAWTSSISQSSNWSSSNDPCNLLLGMGWRLPTRVEWLSADGDPRNWASASDAWDSELKLHMAGYLYYSTGALNNRGSYGRYWSNTQASSSSGYYLNMTGSACSISNMSKAYALPVRCVRDEIVESLPVVSNVELPDSSRTTGTATGWATVVLDGGQAVTERGVCWNTTGTPTVSDNVIKGGAGLGTFSGVVTGLVEGQTYYFRAYATNSLGTAYSPKVTGILSCPTSFDVIHIERLNGAAESKTVTYSSVATDMSGQMACWLTQNLGADIQAGSVSDKSASASGWYWQFNRKQGFRSTGNSYVPKYAWESWINSISQNTDWSSSNDPCRLLLGTGWRLPTNGEWTASDAAPQNWTTGPSAYNSVLKLHYAGYLNSSNGALTGRGKEGRYWSSTQQYKTRGYYLYVDSKNSYMTYYDKPYGSPLRCIRQSLSKSVATVSDVLIPDSGLTATTAGCTATVTINGGAAVTERGFCWNTGGTAPVITDDKITAGSGVGSFTGTLGGLREGLTYYVRAYATNSEGTAYSPSVSQFKICPREFEVIHTAGLDGAPVSKVVTYHSVSSSISGKALCWLTQNLGADREATSVSDGTEPSGGWYWQFNRNQGYRHDGSRYIPSNSYTPWTGSISESYNWQESRDPCHLLLGLGWRLPTGGEWTAADAAPQNWTTGPDAYSSVLKLHYAGYLNYSNGSLGSRGSVGYYWSSTQSSKTTGSSMYISSSTSSISSMNKSYAFPVRCVRDGISISVPSVSDVEIPTSGMTATTASGTATVSGNGGAEITERGFCWSTTGTPDTSDHVLKDSETKLGSFTLILKDLSEDSTYYVRAYAVNSEGTGYSPSVTRFKMCPASFKVIHIERLNGAAESKAVTYHSISSSISGSPSCWLTQNLGADIQAGSVSDKSASASGWYWQFNRKQGFRSTGNSYVPKYAWESWINSISQNTDWSSSNDPCRLLLGTGWRLPTNGEWTASDAAPQNWTTGPSAYNSVLKLHYAGYLNSSNGALTGRGKEGRYWSSTQQYKTRGYYLYVDSKNSYMTYYDKPYGSPLRCIRQSLSKSVATVSDVLIPDSGLTATTAGCTATVTINGGAAVTERGFCWNTGGTAPVITDDKITAGSGVGSFTGTLGGLREGLTYYVRAYATNSEGTAYSPSVSQFKICPREFEVIHTAGLDGAPVSKVVTYHSVSSSISGKALCWLTQNLGADREATSVSDGTEPSGGWYWQFNRNQGYRHDGSRYIPSNSYTPWTGSISESYNWQESRDPCHLLLGLGWRLPTGGEWTAADAAPQNWTTGPDAYSSVLKLHYAGYLNYSNGSLGSRGSVGYYWSSTQSSKTTGSSMYISSSTSSISSMNKSYAFPVRCVRDGISISVPSVSDVEIPTSGMTATTASGTATVSGNGGAEITERGFCWSTTGTPDTSDHVLKDSETKLGSFTLILKDLSEDSTYYVRAYAVNSEGTGYSPSVTRFKMCPASFKVIHIERLNGAAESKAVTYHSISSSISGSPSCWLTQNLGADIQAGSVSDKSASASGWYWQFNRKQGFRSTGNSYVPKYAWESWINSISQNTDWSSSNDPCRLLLGTGWRLPTNGEWTASDAAPQNWTTGPSAYNSVLKLHYAGYLNSSNGALTGRGKEGRYWSSTQQYKTRGYYLYVDSKNSYMTYYDKPYGSPLRCIRQSLSKSVATVSDVLIPDSGLTATTAGCTATVTINGGAAVTERGFCWNTGGTAPVITDDKITAGSGVGSFTGTLGGLREGLTYYVRAYATNSEGTAYSPSVSQFKICPREFEVIHTAGLDGAPVSKVVTYHSVSSSISGKALCWLTQNLGADREATSVSDGTEPSGGWYWQFNRNQGYRHDGSRYIPSNSYTPWTGSISESYNWQESRDPCHLLLGLGWRLPTGGEWTAADAAPQNWTTGPDAYSSVLKLHYAGYLNYSNGSLGSRGSVGYYWSSTQSSKTTGSSMYISSSTSSISSMNKSYAFPVRCVRDGISISVPSVSDVEIPTSGMTATTASGTATVSGNGGAEITERGFCWSTTGTPDTSDHVLKDSETKLGSFTLILKDLSEDSTYYVRAYAVNSEGTGYSPSVTRFKMCPASFKVIHIERLNGAAESKAVTYHSISSSISGSPSCWLTQNLGADIQAGSVSDKSASASGWYWQFNRKQGFRSTGNSYVPKYAWESWINSISQNTDWSSSNDPCRLLLGTGWRLPTNGEWTASDAAPQNWTTGPSAYNSVLKLHYAGYLNSSNGALTGRGKEGRYWSSTQQYKTRGYYLYVDSKNSYMTYYDKPYGSPLRCIRQSLSKSVATVSDVLIPDSGLTATTAGCTATVTINGGAAVTERGFCWNTGGTAPVITDDKITAGSGVGSFTGTLGGLREGLTYYVRAYATNSEGTAYSPSVSQFKICPREFEVIHTAGLDGAPVSKVVTYHSVNSSISGKALCWLTQNLGADREATSVSDGTEPSGGWYWQFNRNQGYRHDGSRYIPSNSYTPWTGSISESYNWQESRDPCHLLLGLGWRLPTGGEWTAADAAPQNWTTGPDAYSSVLKLHYAGYLNYSNGSLGSRGSVGYYWSSTQSSKTTGSSMYISSSASSISSMNKSYAFPVRCVRDGISISVPSVSDVEIPTSGMTAMTASGTATVTISGGGDVTARGLCWNITGTPTISDNVVSVGNGTGSFTGKLTGLSEGSTYYVRAYATNSKGTAYSPSVTSFKMCPKSFSIIHTEGVNGAPVTKTVTYHSVSSNISGKASCWLIQNLGAERGATSLNDATEASAGWYWQFNRKQGYKYNGTIRTPSSTWTNSISQNTDWSSSNDPCRLLLGTGWRIPTNAEWTAADAAPQNWTTGTDAYSSVLKLHYAGYLNSSNGALTGRGTEGRYWSSTQQYKTRGYYLYVDAKNSYMTYYDKPYGSSLRCVHD